MTKTFCDRCGKEIHSNKKSYRFSEDTTENYGTNIWFGHLCVICIENVKANFQRLPSNG